MTCDVDGKRGLVPVAGGSFYCVVATSIRKPIADLDHLNEVEILEHRLVE